MSDRYPNHRLMELIEDHTSGIAGDLAALLSDARVRIGELDHKVHSQQQTIRRAQKRWMPILFQQLVNGDIFKLSDGPIIATRDPEQIGLGTMMGIGTNHGQINRYPDSYVEVWR